MKKLLSALLAAIMLLTCIPLGAIPVFAEEEPEAPDIIQETEPVYYTDLFYAYPYYLAEDAYLKSYSAAVENVYNSVYESYANSPLVVGTGLEKALDVITSPTDIMKLMTDILGISDFSYAEALGAANEDFLKNLLSNDAAFTSDEIIASHNTWADTLNTAISLFNGAEFKDETNATLTVEGYVNLAFSYLLKNGKIKWVSDGMVAKLWDELNDSEFELKDCFDLATTELEMAQAVIYCILLEDIRIGLVDDILATQKSDTVLKQGMNLLKTEMMGNFAVRFCKQFMNTTIADQIWGAIDKLVVESIGSAIKEVISVNKLKTVLKLVHVAYNAFLDVPKYADVLKWQVLMCYSRDLASGIPNYALKYAEGPFLSDAIDDYEALFTAYDAINNAMLDVAYAIKKMQDPFGEAYLVLKEAVENGEEEVTIRTGLSSVNIPAAISSEAFYKMMREGVVTGVSGDILLFDRILPVSISNSITSVTISHLKVNTLAVVFQDSIDEQYYLIENLRDSSAYPGHIASVKNTIQNIPIEERRTIPKDTYSQWTYSFTPENNLKLRHGSDTVESNCIYAVNGVLLGNVILYNSIEAPETDLTVDGYIRIRSAGVTVTGNLGATGNLAIPDDSSLVIYDKMSVNDVTGGWRTNLRVYGDLICNNLGGLANTEVFGSVYAEGDFAIPYWAKATLSGNITANNVSYGYDAVVNMYDTIVCNNFTAGGVGTIYGDVTVYRDLSIDHHLTVETSGSLAVGRNVRIALYGDFTNKGNVEITGNFSPVYGNEIYNYGSLSIEGDVLVVDSLIGSSPLVNMRNWGTVRVHDLNFASNSGYRSQSEKAALYVSGNINWWPGSIGGIVVFNGFEKQTTNVVSYSTVVLENTSAEGVVFDVAGGYRFKIKTLLNHNNNKFTMDAYDASFPDYDGDGMKDNVDPQPTVGNPCTLQFQSDNNEHGSVSLSAVETIGGAVVSVEALPTHKYEFLHWVDEAGKVVSTSATWEPVARGDATYTAVFQKRSQAITATTEGGTIIVPEKAEIDSTVTVDITEDVGYMYQEGSLAYNGIPIADNSFIMPDEPVELTAAFVRNEYYFALAETIVTGKSYASELYTTESFAVLSQALFTAEGVLHNHITQEESDTHIALLQEAMNGLVDRSIVSLEVLNLPRFYIGVQACVDNFMLQVKYDNGVTKDITANECTIVGLDLATLGEQTILVEYEGFEKEIVICVELRDLTECTGFEIKDMVFKEAVTEYRQEFTLTYPLTGDVLVEGVDYMVTYQNNTSKGFAMVLVEGIGDYCGTLEATFEIYADNVLPGTTSVSEDVRGLAFKFSLFANNGQVEYGTQYVNGSATIAPLADGQEYRLVRMGAVVSNTNSVLTREDVNYGSIIDIEAVYLCELDDDSLSYAVRIINIPESGMDTTIYARPYYIYEKDGEEVVVYGDVVGNSYNAVLNG